MKTKYKDLSCLIFIGIDFICLTASFYWVLSSLLKAHLIFITDVQLWLQLNSFINKADSYDESTQNILRRKRRIIYTLCLR